MVKMSGGEALVKSLLREGVDVVFGIPGIRMSGTIAALRDEAGYPHDHDPPRSGCNAHGRRLLSRVRETRRGSGGPGTPVYAMPPPAWPPHMPAPRPCSSSAGQIPRGQIGKNLGAIHEVFDQSGVMSPVTKWRRQVLRPRDVRRRCDPKHSGRCVPGALIPFSWTSHPRWRWSASKSSCGTRPPCRA